MCKAAAGLEAVSLAIQSPGASLSCIWVCLMTCGVQQAWCHLQGKMGWMSSSLATETAHPLSEVCSLAMVSSAAALRLVTVCSHKQASVCLLGTFTHSEHCNPQLHNRALWSTHPNQSRKLGSRTRCQVQVRVFHCSHYRSSKACLFATLPVQLLPEYFIMMLMPLSQGRKAGNRNCGTRMQAVVAGEP